MVSDKSVVKLVLPVFPGAIESLNQDYLLSLLSAKNILLLRMMGVGGSLLCASYSTSSAKPI